MARFTVRAFISCALAEAWLNSLPSNFKLRAMTDTNAYITVAVEEMPISQAQQAQRQARP